MNATSATIPPLRLAQMTRLRRETPKKRSSLTLRTTMPARTPGARVTPTGLWGVVSAATIVASPTAMMGTVQECHPVVAQSGLAVVRRGETGRLAGDPLADHAVEWAVFGDYAARLEALGPDRGRQQDHEGDDNGKHGRDCHRHFES
jgi:hypothetical protein